MDFPASYPMSVRHGVISQHLDPGVKSGLATYPAPGGWFSQRSIREKASGMAIMKLAIAGAGGRMGRTLTRIVREAQGFMIAAGFARAGSAYIGKDMGVLAGIGEIGVTVESDARAAIAKADGVIDFTRPAVTAALSALTAQAGIVHIIGTTGLDEDHERIIKSAALRIAIVKSGNMSLGVNVLSEVVRQVSTMLDKDFDIEITEMHHRHKVDAPSGTALLLGAAAAHGRGVRLDERASYARTGHIGKRVRGDIEFASLRGGSVVGEHTVIFAGDGERLEFVHRAQSRDIFARGALKAALWAREQKPGLYTMSDVLRLGER